LIFDAYTLLLAFLILMLSGFISRYAIRFGSRHEYQNVGGFPFAN